MIRIKVYKKNNKIDKIVFRGHACFEQYGKDIVCAAVSATVLTSINAILSIDENSINVKQNNNNIDFLILNNNVITLKLINNMLNSLKSIEKDYPKNIEIIEEE